MNTDGRRWGFGVDEQDAVASQSILKPPSVPIRVICVIRVPVSLVNPRYTNTGHAVFESACPVSIVAFNAR